MSEDIKMNGPIFDDATGIMEDFVTELKYKVAERVDEIVHRNFSVFKHPTGYYESRVSAERNGTVSDHGVVYGSWLEKGGQGFSGYHSFEKAANEVQNDVATIGDSLLSSKYLRRLS